MHAESSIAYCGQSPEHTGKPSIDPISIVRTRAPPPRSVVVYAPRSLVGLVGVGRVQEDTDYLSITEAAALLGVHRNTVRNRIKVGRYKAHKVLTPQGETYVVARESLGVSPTTPTNQAAQPLTTAVHHNAPNPSQANALVDGAQLAQAEALVGRLLAPFIAELGEVREELGQVKAARDALAQEVAALRAQAVSPVVAAAVPEDRQGVEAPHHAPTGLLVRLRGWWRG